MHVSGNYCEFAVTVPENCPAGTYMPYGIDSNGAFIGEGKTAVVVDCLLHRDGRDVASWFLHCGW